ncbi:hypothetical protein AKJ62_02745 [candidate division MSBL1 archaeon SCGC-AAA259D14]|uniref:Uncharacterized protein n=1 Tax=candidate division MSBL1 archaeon SCGC-AAA259D14 TaxID=1698261 RepID=A0A133U5W3_9EURY|nr:hypothetical protein AKJ62_02745 [candidate division MSBL1 archaeon SCGC-AAA259D14]
MIEKLYERVKTSSLEDKIEFFSDGNNDYTSVLFFQRPSTSIRLHGLNKDEYNYDYDYSEEKLGKFIR